MSAALLLSGVTMAQPTMGLTQYAPVVGEDYVLFSPLPSTQTYLIDRCGNEVKQWTGSANPGTIAQLLPDGSLLRASNIPNPVFTGGGRGGLLERYDWDGNPLWSYTLSNDSLCQHHDVALLPNGNMLVIVWDGRDSSDAVAHGKDPALTNPMLWSERILELEPVGTDSVNVVWEWRLWDHLVQDFDSMLPGYGVVRDHPELVDINFVQGPPNSADWIHMNSVSYNEALDQVVLSSHSLDEIWIIDHSTTTSEAAGHTGGVVGRGGDLLYRWGNPQGYGRGSMADQVFFGQHHASWLPPGHPHEGKILVFNNGLGRPGDEYSSLEIIAPPLQLDGSYAIAPDTAFAPVVQDWIWTAPVPTDFYAHNVSGVYPIGDNYLVTDGPDGLFFQIDGSESVIWRYINPVNAQGPMTQGNTPTGNNVFRGIPYASDFPGFIGHTLIAGAPVELDPLVPSLCATTAITTEINGDTYVYPNPASDHLMIDGLDGSVVEISVANALGSVFRRERIPSGTEKWSLDLLGIAPGMYVITCSGDKQWSQRIVVR
ncbi:MAG: aryl-sulfate sulfotransferase [Flavobacteriales bacterium]|nr:aryl-sulfate sulfotransferase [Flavobacteriales bacterium]